MGPYAVPIDANLETIGVFYLLSFIFYVLDISRKIPQESIPSCYAALLGALLGWGVTVLPQLSQTDLLLAAGLLCLLALAFFTSSKRNQAQNLGDMNYIIRRISYEINNAVKEIKDAIEHSKEK